jgi:drug/metabolite transporter (DMT)-like permease
MANDVTQQQGEMRRGERPQWLRFAPLIFLLLWSAGFTFVKMGLVHAEPMTFLALRYALVLAVMLPLGLVLRSPLPRNAVEWGHLVVVGFLIQALYFGLLYVAMKLKVSASSVALIVSLQPILVATLAPKLVGEKVSVQRWIGLGLGLLGACLVILARSTIEAMSTVGVLCAIGALIGMTAGTIYEKRFGVSQHPVTSNLVQYTVGLIAVLPIAWMTENMHVEWTSDFFLALSYLVIGNSIISVTLLLSMIRWGEASRVSALFFLVPPTAALVAWVLVGELMPNLAWGGMVLAAIGVAIVSKDQVG